MTAAKAGGWAMTAAVWLAMGCTPVALDPMGHESTGGTAGTAGPGGDPATGLVAELQAVAGPGRQLIVATNGGVVTPSAPGPYRVFDARDPEALTEAAAVVGMQVCSVEPQSLAFNAVTSDATGLSIPDAAAFCATDDLAEMIDRLNGLKTPELVVVIAANAAITVHSTNGGINFFGGDDIGRTLRAARRLYIPACIVAPDVLAVPTAPSGQTAGLSTAEALARCGRS